MSDELDELRKIVADFERNGSPDSTHYIGLPLGGWIILLGALQHTVLSFLDPGSAQREIKEVPKGVSILAGTAILGDMIVTSLDLQHDTHKCFETVVQRIHKQAPEILKQQLTFLFGDQTNGEEKRKNRQ